MLKITFTQEIEEPLSTRMSACLEASVNKSCVSVMALLKFLLCLFLIFFLIYGS